MENKNSVTKSFFAVMFMFFGLLFLMWKFRKQIYAFYLKMEKWTKEVEHYAARVEEVLPEIEPYPNDAEDYEDAEMPSNLTLRQQNILELLEDGAEIDMKTISDHIRGVSERTLRRDMNFLETEGLVERIGKTKDTIYRLS